VLQIGGSGDTAVKLLAAGAAEACLLTPVLKEAQLALVLAKDAGYDGRLSAVLGVGGKSCGSRTSASTSPTAAGPSTAP
jgi:hypothetical protein